MHCLNFKTRFLALLASCLLLATAGATAQRLRL